MERAQKESNERLVAMEKSGMAYIEFTPQGEIITADETFINLFGYSSVDEIKGRTPQEFLLVMNMQIPKDYQSFWENLRAGKIQNGIFERFTKK